MDDVALGVEVLFEDVYALCASGRYSSYLGGAFPRRRDYYERFLTLRDISKDELNAWKRDWDASETCTSTYGRAVVVAA